MSVLRISNDPGNPQCLVCGESIGVLQLDAAWYCGACVRDLLTESKPEVSARAVGEMCADLLLRRAEKVGTIDRRASADTRERRRRQAEHCGRHGRIIASRLQEVDGDLLIDAALAGLLLASMRSDKKTAAGLVEKVRELYDDAVYQEFAAIPNQHYFDYLWVILREKT